MKKFKNFTLVELLVVISIIAVLASMLLPVLNKVRDISKGILCVNNQKQIGITFMSYAGDSGDYLVFYSPYGDSWGTFLARNDYISRSESLYENMFYLPNRFTCPLTLNTATYKSKYIYAHNSYGLRMDKPNSIDGDYYFRTFYKTTKIPVPSTFGYLADSIRVSALVPKSAYYHFMGSDDVTSFRHAKTANLYCVDGHVSRVKVTDRSRYLINNYYVGSF